MTTYSNYRPISPTVMAPQVFRLAGHIVSERMYQAAKATKDISGRVFLTLATPAAGPDLVPSRFRAAHCQNCEGAGAMFLEVVTGGPYKNPPNPKRGSEDGDMEVPASYDDRQWYLVARTRYECPCCHGNPLGE